MRDPMDEVPPWAGPEDESYWGALLSQGEVAYEGPPRGVNGDGGRMLEDESLLNMHPTRDQWAQLKAYFDEGAILQGRVIGCNRGGLLVRVGETVGFVPASQLADLPRRMESEELREELERRLGEELDLKLIELDRSRNRIILSERAAAWTGGGVDARLAQLRDFFFGHSPGALLLASGPQQSASERQEIAQLEAALQRLSPPLREVILLVAVEELDQNQAAEVLGLQPAALRKRLERARAQLQLILSQSERGGSDGNP